MKNRQRAGARIHEDCWRCTVFQGACAFFGALVLIAGVSACHPGAVEPWLEDLAERSCNPDDRNYEECIRSQREIDSRVRNTPPIYPEGR